MKEIAAFMGVFTLEHLCSWLFKRHVHLCTNLHVQTTGAEWINTETQGLAPVCVFKGKSFPHP